MNNRGGVEIDLTVTPVEAGIGELHDPIFKGRGEHWIQFYFTILGFDAVSFRRAGYYCVAGGASMYHTIAHMREAIQEKNFRAKVTDVTHELGVLSIQGQWNGAKVYQRINNIPSLSM